MTTSLESHTDPTISQLRRVAQRQGLMLVKSRRRDPDAEDFGLFVLVGDSWGNRVGRYGVRRL